VSSYCPCCYLPTAHAPSLAQLPSPPPLPAFAALYHQESSFAPLPTAGELHLQYLTLAPLTQLASNGAGSTFTITSPLPTAGASTVQGLGAVQDDRRML
jgi:hypothetical protein